MLSTIVTRAVVAVASVALVLIMSPAAQAHVVCGNRVFPATLTMDDPGQGDELSLPTISQIPNPTGSTTVYAYEWDKRITKDLGWAINGDYTSAADQVNGANNGWDTTTITLKDEGPCDKQAELAWSIGVIRMIPGSGSKRLANAGIIPSVGTTAPTLYFGKGLGDLGSESLRPFAITGEVSRVFSDSPATSPNAWNYAASLQYSIPYQQQHVLASKIPPWTARLIPLVEVSMTSPDGSSPTGTIAPGILYEANTWQLGAEALFPANSTTRGKQGTGFVIQFHVFLDDLAYKTWWGKPIINKNLWGNKE